MSPRPVILTGLLAVVGVLVAAPAPAQAASGASWEALRVRAGALLEPVERETAIDLAFRVETLDGTVLVDHHGDRRLALASNLKLFTSAAALLALGPEYRWETRVLVEGEDLRIVGGGDPSLRELPDGDATAAFLDALADALVARGRDRVGSLIVDGGAFAVAGPHPLWPRDQLQAEYAAPVAALAVEGGLMHIAWREGRARSLPRLGGEVRLQVLDAGGASLSAWWGQDGEIRVRPPNRGRTQEVRLAQRDPLRTAGWALAAGLRRRGIAVGEVVVEGPATGGLAATEAGAAVVAEQILLWPSRWTLADAVMVCNKDSDNFVAEVLLLTLGMEREGVGSWESGERAAREALTAKGLEVPALDFADGSGLARDWPRVVDASTAAETCALLRRMAAADAAGRVFFDSLPIGGVDGSLASRFREAAFQPQRVHAKTGFILGASSLSGYLLAGDEQVLVFSFLVNFDRARNKDTNNRRFREIRRELLAMVLEEAS